MGDVHTGNDPLYDVKNLVWFVETAWSWNPFTATRLVLIKTLVLNTFKAECGENLYTIMLNCWCLEAVNRPKCSTLIEFFTNYRNEMCPYESLILITGRDAEGQMIKDQEMPAMVKIADLETKENPKQVEPG